MSLYRKYRPQIFADLIGQEHIKQTLQNELAHGKTVHAYIFSGPRAVGKTSSARIFVRALNCAKRKPGESEPCNACAPCTALLSGTTLDMIEIDAASHTGVDNVRENIIAAARVGNTQLTWKAFIIDEVHMLSTAAFNALLKLIEEPPASVVFILATTELHKVPATIVSRCQRFEFKKIPPSDMEKRLKKLAKLEKREIDDEVIDEIVRLSDGWERDAESLLGQLLSLDPKKITMEKAEILLPRSNHGIVKELVANIIEKNSSSALSLVERLIDEGVDIEVFLDDVMKFLHSLLLLKAGSVSPNMPSHEQKALTELAKTISSEQLITWIEHYLAAQRDLAWFSLPQLPLQIAIIRCTLSET